MPGLTLEAVPRNHPQNLFIEAYNHFKYMQPQLVAEEGVSGKRATPQQTGTNLQWYKRRY